MVEDFQHKGLWFLPSTPSIRVAGTIRFEVKVGLTLDLIGSFPPIDKKIELIWGILENGDFVTLFNSFEIYRSVSLPGLIIANYRSNFLFNGAHFTSKKDLSFNKLSVHYSYLDEWLSINSGFQITTNPQEYKISIEYQLPNPIEVNLDNKTKLSVNLVATSPSKKIVQKDAIIRQKAFIDFNYNRKTSFDKILENSFHFQNFLTLCLQQPAYHKEVIAYMRIKGDKRLHKIRVYFQVNHLPDKEKELVPMDMLIQYKKIASNFEPVIKSWYNKREMLETAHNPFFSTYYNPYLYITDKFLDLARSIEALHRDTVGVINPATRKEYYFKDRINEIYSEFSRQFNPTLKINSKTKFIDKLKKYRNDYTHSNPILKSKDKRYLELYYLSEKIQIIMTCALLYQHHITKEEIKKSINETRLYAHLRVKLR